MKEKTMSASSLPAMLPLKMNSKTFSFVPESAMSCKIHSKMQVSLFVMPFGQTVVRLRCYGPLGVHGFLAMWSTGFRLNFLRNAQMSIKSFCPQNCPPPPRKKCQFSGFSTDLYRFFLILGPFRGGGGLKPNFADKNFMDTQTFLNFPTHHR